MGEREWVEHTAVIQKHLKETSVDNDVFIPPSSSVCGGLRFPHGLFRNFKKTTAEEEMTARCTVTV